MFGRLLRVTGTVLVMAVAFVTPVLATAAATPASAATTPAQLNSEVSGPFSGTSTVQIVGLFNDPQAFDATYTTNAGTGSFSISGLFDEVTSTSYTFSGGSFGLTAPDGATLQGTAVGTETTTIAAPLTASLSITLTPTSGTNEFADVTGVINLTGTWQAMQNAGTDSGPISGSLSGALNPGPPTTSVLLPSNGATVSGGSWLDALASSPVGIASVTFEVSGGSSSDQVISSGYPTLYGYLGGWDAADVPNGTYTLQSVATDTLGQSTTSAGITVTFDNPPLNTEVLVPSNGATLSGTAAVLDASATGTSPVTSVQFEVSGGSLSNDVVGTATLTLAGWIFEWDTTTVPNGTYTLQSVATEVGGTTATSAPITITVSN